MLEYIGRCYVNHFATQSCNAIVLPYQYIVVDVELCWYLQCGQSHRHDSLVPSFYSMEKQGEPGTKSCVSMTQSNIFIKGDVHYSTDYSFNSWCVWQLSWFARHVVSYFVPLLFWAPAWQLTINHFLLQISLPFEHCIFHDHAFSVKIHTIQIPRKSPLTWPWILRTYYS